MAADIECPCGYSGDADDFGCYQDVYRDGNEYEVECPECGAELEVAVSVDISFTVEPVKKKKESDEKDDDGDR